MLKKLLIIMLCIAMLVSIAIGCKPAAEETTTAAEETMEATEQEGPIKVMFIPKNQGNPYFDALIQGFEEAEAEIGADKLICDDTGPATAEATSQIEFIEAAVQNGYNSICIAANSNDALNSTFEDAMSKGVKIIIINGDIPGSEEYRDASILPTDFSIVGASQVECLGSIIDYEGEIAILSATTDAPDQNFWIEGMKETLENDPKYAKMTLVDIVYGDDQPEKSTTEMEGLIAKYPNLRGVISPTTVGVTAAAEVVQTKGLADKIAVTGLDLPSLMREYIKDGTVEKFQLWNPVDEGYLGAWFSWLLVKGEVEAKEGAMFTASRLGEYTIGLDRVIITGPPFTFDASNIDDFDF